MFPSDKMHRKRAWINGVALAFLGVLAVAAGTFVPGLIAEDPVRPPTTPAPATASSIEYTPPPMPSFPSPRAMLLRLTLGTLFVLILCVITVHAARLWLRPGTQLQAGSGELRLLETLALNRHCSVYLLQAGNTRTLAGVDSMGLKVLLPLPESFAESLEQTVAAPEQEAPEERAA